MTTIITRLYATPDRASAVVDALKADGFMDRDISMFSAGTSASTIQRAGVYAKAAQTYADHVAKGAALVVCRAPTGSAYPALAVVDQFPAIDAGVKYTEVLASAMIQPAVDPWRPYATLITGATFFGWIKHTISDWSISNVIGFPPVLKNYQPRAALLTVADHPFSWMTSMPLLTRRERWTI